MNVSECRSALSLLFLLHLAIFQIEDNSLLLYVAHHDVAYANILDHTAATSGTLDANASVCSVENTVADGNLLNAATHLASDNHAAVSRKHRAVCNRDVLARNANLSCLIVAASLDCDTVVANRDVAVAYMNILAALRVDSVGIWRQRIVDCNAMNRYIVAEFRIHSPERRILDMDALNLNVLASHRLNERRSEEAILYILRPIHVCLSLYSLNIVGIFPHLLIFVCSHDVSVANIKVNLEFLIPPSLSLSVDSTLALYRDVFAVNGINQRLESLHNNAFVTVPKELLSSVSSVELEVMLFSPPDDDAPQGLLIYMGSDMRVNEDWDKGVFTDTMDGTWAAMDGHMLPLTVSNSTDDYITYDCDIKINGVPYNMVVAYDREADTYGIMGVQKINEDGVPGRLANTLKPGDKITTRFYVTSLTGDDEQQLADIETFEYRKDSKIKDEDLGESQLVFSFTFNDAFGNSASSELVALEIDDKNELTIQPFDELLKDLAEGGSDQSSESDDADEDDNEEEDDDDDE